MENTGDEEDVTVVIYKTIDDFKSYDTDMEKTDTKNKLQTQHPEFSPPYQIATIHTQHMTT
ncbi:C-type lectin domain family 4 member E-like isoform X1 [Clarias magur]|uniref:C-type lectin domain family 4 member E-like isoform X1 n=1 Tax=Clarias magur TaxID=1594786 RepID=A0A8J4TXW9_CLAMG|nr:C-type lectin domain family 4 member E-like isoform X1 [Clarias magur]